MAYQKTITIKGLGEFTISPAIKKFTLIDLGFITNNAGTYVLKRSLQPDMPVDQAISLKVVFKKNLSAMKLEVIGAAGGPVDIDAREDAKDMLDLVGFFLKEMTERQVLEQIA